MFCTNCGSNLHSEAMFCHNCGAKANPTPSPITGNASANPTPQEPNNTPFAAAYQPSPYGTTQNPTPCTYIPTPQPRKKRKAPLIIAVIAVILSLLTVAAFFMVRHMQEAHEIDKIIARADKFAADGNYDAAVSSIKIGMRKYPDSALLQKKASEYLFKIVLSDTSPTENVSETEPNEPYPSETMTEAPETEEPVTQEAAFSEENIKMVALITDIGAIDDKSYNEMCWSGVQQWCESADVSYRYYRPSEDSDSARITSIETAIAEGANAIVLPSFLFGIPILELQNNYPDVYFIGIDLADSDLTYDYVDFEAPADNTACITFAEEQAGYLAGYAAVMDGYTQLGVLGGMSIPVVVRYCYGFIQGADAAAMELGVEINIKYAYSNSFAPAPEITAQMEGWYFEGTEVVFACGGGIYLSAVEAAASNAGKVICVDVDLSHEDDCIITTAEKCLTEAVITALDFIHHDKQVWDDRFGGQCTRLSLADGDYISLPTDDEAWRFSKFTVEEYEEVRRELANGTRCVDDSSDSEVFPIVSSYTTISYT